MIRIYGTPLSPFVRKVLLTLEYKGLAYDNVPTFPGANEPAFRAMSPLGKVPALDHDGFTVSDSSVICRYLDRIALDKPIYPEDPQQEATACWLEEYADSRLTEACAAVFQERLLKPKLLKQPTDEARLADALDRLLPECLRYLERVVPDSGYLVGDSLSIADIAVVCCFVQARYGDFDVDGGVFPKLRRYLDQAYAAPLLADRLASEQANLPPGLA